MKINRWLKKLLKFNAVLVCLGLILGGTYFSPVVNAKTIYKTLAFDKKLETVKDFEKGEFKNSKIKETAQGVEVSSMDDNIGEYITPVIQSLFGATYIGLHWKQELSDDAFIIAYIRTSSDGINFSEWIETTVEADEGRDDMKSDEVFAALVGVEKASFAQAKIEFIPSKGISPKLNNFTFTFINSGEESKQTTNELSFAPKSIAGIIGTPKISPNGQNINVISREDWGADESYRLTRRGAEAWPRSYHGNRKLIVHHTAGASSNGVTDLETNKATVRAIYYYHAVTQGWGDIGYNALVDAAGNIYEGRYGTHDVVMRTSPTPDQIMVLDVEAAQASSYNSGSFGVSAMGDFTNFDIPDAQLAGMENVLAFVADSRGIDALGSSDFRRNDGAWHMDLNNIVGHRDVNATLCPGDRFYLSMANIKTKVATLMQPSLSNFSATVNSVPVSGSSVGLGMLNFSWDGFPNSTQYQFTLERVFGTAGVASDSEPWQTAWLNAEDINTKTITNTSVQIDAGTLKANSNYVFYVRALDASGMPISSVSHVNFFKDSSITLDTEKPTVTITAPANGANIIGTVSITASASDNVGVTSMKLYIDGKQTATSSTVSLNYSWNTKKVTVGLHTINVKAFDAAGNPGEATIIVNRVK
ncbi:N-acetylmuramoyl-L-alanine amidase [Patescibacteria group bacterium]|nr:N-acetylmuramoyl-L-alanine amidase [Patescibacteria group bacterium]MBU4580688.1 N-acetylmuramoyl-L-alanine amidase [Patescibacteria group bacterium]